MLACQKKIFNKFFVFSIVFLIFSFCCHASEVVTVASAKKQGDHKTCEEARQVQTQQRKIIHSLENIERDLVSRK